MTRISFNEKGDPIPLEALPDGITEDTDLAPITFQPVDGEIFTPADWIAFGYTHFEVSCVGAAGGKAGIAQYFCGYSGWFPSSGQYLYSFGGAGGGGGLHVVTGELGDLPATCDIVVGESGADGAPVGGWSPSSNASEIARGTAGVDGGFSSFADDICMASGGKGGEISSLVERLIYMTGASINNILVEQTPGGNGGDGGIGGQTAAGGGGAGAESIKIAEGDDTTFDLPDTWRTDEGEDGSWDGEIGAGGGGGSGGQVNEWSTVMGNFVGFDPEVDGSEGDYYVKYSNQLIYWVHPARNGGKGSFSFSDGSKTGARGVRSSMSPPFGVTPVGTQPIVPGGGGGARPTSLLKYGSDSPGYSPEGFVLIRVFKVV